jgi:hypothetical protein
MMNIALAAAAAMLHRSPVLMENWIVDEAPRVSTQRREVPNTATRAEYHTDV